MPTIPHIRIFDHLESLVNKPLPNNFDCTASDCRAYRFFHRVGHEYTDTTNPYLSLGSLMGFSAGGKFILTKTGDTTWVWGILE